MAKSHTGESMSQPDSMPSQPPRLDAAPPAAPPDVPATQAAARKQWLFLLRLTLLVLLVVLSFKLVRAGLFAMSAYNSAAELRGLSRSGDVTAADLAQAQTSVAEAARSVASLERELRLFAARAARRQVRPAPGADRRRYPRTADRRPRAFADRKRRAAADGGSPGRGGGRSPGRSCRSALDERRAGGHGGQSGGLRLFRRARRRRPDCARPR